MGQAELGAAYGGHQRIAGRPGYLRSPEEAVRAVGQACRTGVAGGRDHRDTVAGLSGQLVGPAQRPEHGTGPEGRLGRAEALADHASEMMPDDILLSFDDLREAATPLIFGGRCLNQQDSGFRCHHACPLHIQRRLASGTCPRRRWPVAGHRARRRDHPQQRRRQAEPLVENGQVMPDRRRSKGLDNRDRLALATDALTQQRPQVISCPDLRRAQAATRQARGRADPPRTVNLPVDEAGRAPRQAHSKAERHRPGTRERN